VSDPPADPESMTAGSRHGDPPVGRHRRRVRSRWSDRRAGAFQTGWTVLILERGQKAPVAGSMAQTFRELRMPGRSLLLTDRPLAVLRGVTVGGSSIYFFGTPWEPPYELFDKRGVDIHAEVAAARRTAPVAPLPPELIGPKGPADHAQRDPAGVPLEALEAAAEVLRPGPRPDPAHHGRPWLDQTAPRGPQWAVRRAERAPPVVAAVGRTVAVRPARPRRPRASGHTGARYAPSSPTPCSARPPAAATHSPHRPTRSPPPCWPCGGACCSSACWTRGGERHHLRNEP